MTWSEPPRGAAGYKIERGTGPNGPFTEIAAGVTSLTFGDTGLPANATYYYRVRATNALGRDGEYSGPASVTTPVDPEIPIPGAPGTPTYTNIAKTYFFVNWTAASGAVSYKIECAPDVDGTAGAWTEVRSGVAGLSAVSDIRTPNTAYWYRVRGTNGGGDGPYSAASRVMTLPNAPGTPTFSNVAYNTVTVNWTAPTGGAASYTVDRSTASGQWTQIATAVTALSYTDATVAGNKTYWYRVGATNLTGSSYTVNASVTTPVDPGTPVPGAPGTPTYTTISRTSLYVNWTAATGAVSYKVERAPDVSGAPGAWTQIASAVTALNCLDSALIANTAYWYRVRATNSGGDGPYSAARSVMTLPNAPGTPTFSNVAYNTVTVNWTAPTGGAASYTVDRATASSGPWTQIATAVTALSYTDATVAGNKTYWYRVGATNLTGSSYSSSVWVTTPRGDVGAFGRTTYGASSNQFPDTNNKSVSRFILPERASEILKMTAYSAQANATVKVRPVVYADASGEPGALIAVGNERVGVPVGWYDLTFATPFGLEPGNYFLGVIADSVINTAGVASTGINRWNADAYADGPTDPFGTATTSSYEKPIYATYRRGDLRIFGRDTYGASSNQFPDANNKSVSRFILPERASEILKLTAYSAQANATVKVRPVVYADASGEPGALIAVGNERVGVPVGWYDLTFATPFGLEPGNYFLGVIADSVINTAGVASTGINRWNADAYADGPTDPFGTATSSSYEKPIYATYKQ